MSAFDENAIQSHRLPRVRVEQSIAAVCRVDGHVRRSAAKTKDLSMSGVFFYADFSPDLRSSVQLMLTFPPEITYGEPISAICQGTVLRVERNTLAGKFGVAVEIRSYELVGA
jgi:PilZ domain